MMTVDGGTRGVVDGSRGDRQEAGGMAGSLATFVGSHGWIGRSAPRAPHSATGQHRAVWASWSHARMHKSVSSLGTQKKRLEIQISRAAGKFRGSSLIEVSGEPSILGP
jgi:hypothetical protein